MAFIQGGQSQGGHRNQKGYRGGGGSRGGYNNQNGYCGGGRGKGYNNRNGGRDNQQGEDKPQETGALTGTLTAGTGDQVTVILVRSTRSQSISRGTET